MTGSPTFSPSALGLRDRHRGDLFELVRRMQQTRRPLSLYLTLRLQSDSLTQGKRLRRKVIRLKLAFQETVDQLRLMQSGPQLPSQRTTSR